MSSIWVLAVCVMLVTIGCIDTMDDWLPDWPPRFLSSDSAPPQPRPVATLVIVLATPSPTATVSPEDARRVLPKLRKALVVAKLNSESFHDDTVARRAYLNQVQQINDLIAKIKTGETVSQEEVTKALAKPELH